MLAQVIFHFQTYTQAERKIVEAKKEALLKEASQNALSQSSLTRQLAQLDSIKPRPYGTIQAVNTTCLNLLSSSSFTAYSLLYHSVLFYYLNLGSKVVTFFKLLKI